MVAYSYAEGMSHRAEHIVYTKSRLAKSLYYTKSSLVKCILVAGGGIQSTKLLQTLQRFGYLEVLLHLCRRKQLVTIK